MRFDNKKKKSRYVFIIVRKILVLKEKFRSVFILKKRWDLIEKSRSIFILKENMRFDRKIQIYFYHCRKQKI